MRSRYRFMLLSVVVLGLLWLNLGADRSTDVVKAVVRQLPSDINSDAAYTSSVPLQGATKIAVLNERPVLEVGEQDPFAPEVSRPVNQVKPAPPPLPLPVLAIAAPPSVPELPPLNLIYSGRMTTPEGNTLVYATLSDEPIALMPGTELANGYRVTKITERTVELIYPPLDRAARLDLPATQKYETR